MKKALLFVNLGTPSSPNVKDVRRYLRQFLTDPYVISIPVLFRYMLVYGIIAPFRGPKSAHAYQTIWDNEKGSPLLFYSIEFLEKFKKLSHEYDHVDLAMRYGEPSIKSAIERVNHSGVKKLSLFNLYPQYAESTTKTAVDEVVKYLNPDIELEYLPYFYSNSEYLNSMTKSLESYQGFDHTLFSYHGLPESHIQKLDQTGKCLTSKCCEALDNTRLDYCYRAQCFHTTKLIAERLQIKKWSYSFQSRFGKKWIKPFTDIEVERLAKEGVKRLLVVSPAFVTDCLETLEELHIGLKESFLQAGGVELKVVPCLNANDDWVEACLKITQDDALWRHLHV
ncbi:MAG: ferrochelatase [Bdellovibrionales bacterium]|nr:ferrochelatase [Bdellovibrionales bacterium]